MNKLGILNKLFGSGKKDQTQKQVELSKIEKNNKFEIPDSFKITESDVSYYTFMKRGKAFTGPLELERDGGRIDREIEEYKKTDIYKILSSKVNDLDFEAIAVGNPPYIAGNLDLTLGIENNAFKRLLFNPSEGLALLTKMNQKNDITLGDYLTLITPAIMSYSEVIYIKGKVLKFVYKLSFLRGENDNNNDELTFVSNVDDKGANNISEYIARCDKNDYQLKLVSDPSSKIVIQNLKVDDEVLQKISIFYSKLQLGSFSELSIFLEQNFQNQITFIGMMNGVLVVKGNDETERCIYTSLTKEELTDGMKEIVESPMTRELQ